jgi:hypothetical protein
VDTHNTELSFTVPVQQLTCCVVWMFEHNAFLSLLETLMTKRTHKEMVPHELLL